MTGSVKAFFFYAIFGFVLKQIQRFFISILYVHIVHHFFFFEIRTLLLF